MPFPQQQGAPGVPGPAATPPPRQGGPGYGQFPTYAQPGQPQGRYGPSTFRSSDIDEPDWSALAEQNEAWQERKYLDMEEFTEWAAARTTRTMATMLPSSTENRSSLTGSKHIYSRFWT